MNKLFGLMFLLALSPLGLADEVPAAVHDRLKEALPGYDAAQVRPAPLAGLFEFVAEGRVLYISADGRYVVSGDIIDLEANSNLTQARQGELTLKLIEELGEAQMLVFAGAETKHTVTVFTDVDCPYCAMLHKEVPKLNAAGVTVRYLLYPRAGIASPTFKKSVSVWCAKDPHAAIGVAKSGGEVEARDCDNPVADHYRVGQMAGVTGTPTLVLEDGRILPGYLPAEKLIQVIDKKL